MKQHLNHASPARRIRAAVAHSRRQLAEQLRRAADAPDERFGAAYRRLLASAELRFRHEQSVMDALGFSAAGMHREGNARTLAVLRQAESAVADGDVGTGRCALGLLARVLPLHRFTVDLALISRQRHAPRPGPRHYAIHGALRSAGVSFGAFHV
ncbi:hypothetical protein [uncultured Massilia sp.]|uniref:hypothetical protein n=1 Tax=uncultured Massilia sp. TaxID=169973 RepID=UPI0025D27B16|nr:hypothetical protein [uncultured Massilia sp.]